MSGSETSVHFDRITLIGIGLIGSSIARDVKQLGLANEVVISTRSEETLKRAEELELGTHYVSSAAKAVEGADLVIVSVPVGASEAVAQQIAAHLKPGAIVTDVGSTKRPSSRRWRRICPTMCISFPAIRWRVRKSRVLMRVLPVSSAIAGAFSRRCRIRMRTPSTG